MSQRWLDRVIEALKAPVDHSEDLDRRILDAVRSEPRPNPPPRSRRAGGIGVRLGGLATAAAIAALWWLTPLFRRSASTSFGTSSVVFEIAEPGARQVALVGDFNDWDRARTPLVREGDRWRATVRLPTGVYRYAFLIDGVRWVADPRKPGPADLDFGQPISMLAMR